MSAETVISLSSIPPRFGQLGPTLDSLLRQDRRADAILLWVPPAYRRFPDWDGHLPEVPAGVSLLRAAEDVGPATKVLPAVDRYRGREMRIVFCDDDKVYPPSWLATLLAVGEDRPGQCIAAAGEDIPGDIGRPTRAAQRLPRTNTSSSVSAAQTLVETGRMLSGRRLTVRSSGYVDMLKGVAGVLIRPDFLPPPPHVIPPVVWAVDDVWLSGQMERNGVPIWMDTRIPFPAPSPAADGLHALLGSEIDGHRREAANRAAVGYFRSTYGIWRPAPAERLLSRFRPAAARLSHRIKRTAKALRRSARRPRRPGTP